MSQSSAPARPPLTTRSTPINMLDFFEPLRGTEMHLAEYRSVRDRRMAEVLEALGVDEEHPLGS